MENKKPGNKECFGCCYDLVNFRIFRCTRFKGLYKVIKTLSGEKSVPHCYTNY